MYKNVEIDLKPQPVLEELIKDCFVKDIELLDEVIERVYAQQELINLRSEQIIGLN